MNLFGILLEFLESIPTNAAIALLAGLGAYFINRDDKRFKKIDDDHLKVFNRLEEGELVFDRIDEKFNQVEGQLTELTLIVLKDVIYNESMNLLERQHAYEQYKSLGGNGFVEAYYEQKIEPRLRDYIKEGRVG